MTPVFAVFTRQPVKLYSDWGGYSRYPYACARTHPPVGLPESEALVLEQVAERVRCVPSHFDRPRAEVLAKRLGDRRDRQLALGAATERLQTHGNVDETGLAVVGTDGGKIRIGSRKFGLN